MQKLIVTAEVRRLNCHHIYSGRSMAWNPLHLCIFLWETIGEYEPITPVKPGCKICNAPYGLEIFLQPKQDAESSIRKAFAEAKLTITKLSIEHIGENGKPILSLF